MFNTKKVIWKEGMFLQPQHFQQAERFLLNTIDNRFCAYHPFYYGVIELEIDQDALANGTISVSRCSGIFPDGTTFSIPHEDKVPPSRSLAEYITIDQQTLDLYLALPLIAEGRSNISNAGNDSYVRYKSHTVEVTDEVMGLQKKQVETGHLNCVVRFEGESLDNYTSLPIGRLRRNANGKMVLQEDYIPPLLHHMASRNLSNHIRGLLEILLAKNATLSQGRKLVEGGLAEFGNNEETAFRLLQTINTYLPLLHYYQDAPGMHPFSIYSILSMLAGGLITFSADATIRDIPRYDHYNLSKTFSALNLTIRRVLEADISAGCVTIPIEQLNPATYLCKVPDERLFATATFYLGVSANIPKKELVVGTLQRIKMCSREKLDLLISSAMPGIPLMHTSDPPEGLSTKPGFIYFSLDQHNQFWEGIRTSGTIAFYFPHNYPDLKMEFLALKE